MPMGLNKLLNVLTFRLWGSSAECQQPCCGEVRFKVLGEGSGPCSKYTSLATEMPLWDFSFSYLIQNSLKSMIYVAPYMGA